MWSVAELAAQVGYRVVAQSQLEARQARFSPVPVALHYKLKQQLTRSYPAGLYSHQAAAIEAFLVSDWHWGLLKDSAFAASTSQISERAA